MSGSSLETTVMAPVGGGAPSADPRIDRLADRRWIVLPVLCLSVFLVVVDNTIVNVALPTLNRTLGASITSLQWIVDAYSLAFAGLLLAGGGIGDRLGRKGTMQVGLVFFGLFSAAAAFSDSTGTLIATRTLMGVAAAFIFPASLAILTSVFPDPSERQKALGIWGATSGIAVAFGPIVGGALLEHFWYGSIFLVNVPIVAVTLIAGGLLIPRLPKVRQHPFDIRGVVVSTAGVLLLVLAIIEGPQWGWASAGTLACFGGAAVLLTAFTLLELRTEGPLLDVRVFKIPRFTGGALSISVAFFCLFGFIFLITQYFQFVKGYSTLSAGLHTLPFAIVAAIFTPIAAVVALRVGTRLVVGLGAAADGRWPRRVGFQLVGGHHLLRPDHHRHGPAGPGSFVDHGTDGRGRHGLGVRRADAVPPPASTTRPVSWVARSGWRSSAPFSPRPTHRRSSAPSAPCPSRPGPRPNHTSRWRPRWRWSATPRGRHGRRWSRSRSTRSTAGCRWPASRAPVWRCSARWPPSSCCRGGGRRRCSWRRSRRRSRPGGAGVTASVTGLAVDTNPDRYPAYVPYVSA